MGKLRFRVSKEHVMVLDEIRDRLEIDRKSIFTLLVLLESNYESRLQDSIQINNTKGTEVDLYISDETKNVFDVLCIKNSLSKVQCFLNLVYKYRSLSLEGFDE